MSEAFLKRLDQGIAKAEDDDDFFAAIIRDAPITDGDLSIMCMVSRPSVDRWKMGKSTPHPLMKQRIYELLRDWTLRGAK